MASASKLNLGCGQDYREGYFNVDVNHAVKADEYSSLRDFHWEDDSTEEILLSHVVMYLRPEDLRPLLKRWLGWLKKDGKLEIESSDIKKCCEIVATNTDPQIVHDWGLVNIFGDGHKWGWSPDALMIELYDAGFKECLLGQGKKKPNRDFRIIAIKR